MKIQDSQAAEMPTPAANAKEPIDLGALFDGKRVELPHVVVMKFENGKVAHEHVWWDQASLLVQVGLLDGAKLPVVGVEQARKLLRIAGKNGD